MSDGRPSDVLIVGGGVIGCACAWRIAQRGLRVTLLERGECGRAASWAGAGIIEMGSYARRDAMAMLRRESANRYLAFTEELRDISGVDCEYTVSGSLDLITDDKQDAAADREVRAAAGRVTPAGEPVVERMSIDEARRLAPVLSAELPGALLRRETAQVRNPRVLSALRTACARVGVQVVEGAEAQGWLREGRRVTGVVARGERWRASRVVLAAGAWSQALLEQLAITIHVFPVRGQIVLLHGPVGLLKPVLECGRRYVVPRRDGHLLIGSTEEPRAGFDASPTSAGVALLRRFASAVAPSLAEARFVRAWAGLRPGTDDSRPYIGPAADAPGLILATGHYRNGLTLAPVTADLVAQFVTDEPPELDLRPFAADRPAPARAGFSAASAGEAE